MEDPQTPALWRLAGQGVVDGLLPREQEDMWRAHLQGEEVNPGHEAVQKEGSLGLPIFHFHIKCTCCLEHRTL